MCVEVGEDPGEHRVLVQVIVGSTCGEKVELSYEVLKNPIIAVSSRGNLKKTSRGLRNTYGKTERGKFD